MSVRNHEKARTGCTCLGAYKMMKDWHELKLNHYDKTFACRDLYRCKETSQLNCVCLTSVLILRDSPWNTVLYIIKQHLNIYTSPHVQSYVVYRNSLLNVLNATEQKSLCAAKNIEKANWASYLLALLYFLLRRFHSLLKTLSRQILSIFSTGTAKNVVTCFSSFIAVQIRYISIRIICRGITSVTIITFIDKNLTTV